MVGTAGDHSFILCSSTGDSIVHLQIQGVGVEGALLPAIGNLSNLVVLSIATVAIKNDYKIPAEIGNLVKLERFIFRQTSGLTDSSGFIRVNLTSGICALTRLIRLDLSLSNFGGTIPVCIGNLAQLEYLDLGQNSFGGVVPDGIASLVNLTTLRLAAFSGVRANSLQGSLPLNLSTLTRLTYLTLSQQSGLCGTLSLPANISTCIVSITSLCVIGGANCTGAANCSDPSSYACTVPPPPATPAIANTPSVVTNTPPTVPVTPSTLITPAPPNPPMGSQNSGAWQHCMGLGVYVLISILLFDHR
jgi:hypothetical protein